MIINFVTLVDALAYLLVTAGSLFFLLGSIGLLRFRSLYARLHALTKVDSLGLGLIAVGAFLLQPGLVSGALLLAIWMLVMMASAASGYLIAYLARQRGTE